MSLTVAIDLLLALAGNAGKISALISQARAEGRDTLTADEWATVVAADDAARKKLVDAIA